MFHPEGYMYHTTAVDNCKCFTTRFLYIDLTPGKSITASESELSEIRAASRRFSFIRRNFYGRLNNLAGGGNNGRPVERNQKPSAVLQCQIDRSVLEEPVVSFFRRRTFRMTFIACKSVFWNILERREFCS
jgi:hypothetical protein